MRGNMKIDELITEIELYIKNDEWLYDKVPEGFKIVAEPTVSFSNGNGGYGDDSPNLTTLKFKITSENDEYINFGFADFKTEIDVKLIDGLLVAEVSNVKIEFLSFAV
jgi:hypothetical protein